MIRAKPKQKHIPGIVGLLLAFAVAMSLMLNAWHYHHRSWAAKEKLLYFPNARGMHAYALGFERFMADLLWMRTLAYFGGQLMGDRDFRYLAYMLDIITQLHPRHEAAYYMAAAVLPWMPGALDDAARLTIRASVNMPQDGRWDYYLGAMLYMFADNRVVAAHYLKRAIAKGYANPLAIGLAARLQSAVAGLDAAADLLRRNIGRQQDRHVRRFLEEQLALVETERILRQLERSIAAKGGKVHNIDDLKEMGLHWPDPLPDGGQLRIDASGALFSSANPKRFTLFRSQKLPAHE